MGEDRSIHGHLNEVLDGIQIGAFSKERTDIDAEKFYWNYVPWGFQADFHKDIHRVRAVFCGNRVGKSTMAIMEVFVAMTGKIPPGLKKIFPEKKIAPPNSIAWLCTLTDSTLETITLPKIRECVPLDAFGIKYLAAKNQFLLPEGKVIYLKSYEQGRESFQGAGVWMINFDEECSKKEIYTECMTRLLSTGGYMMLTMTPLQGKTWTYYSIYVKAEHDNSIKVYRANMYEAPHLDKVAVDKMVEIYPEHERKARIYGDFTIAADKRFFNPAKVNQWFLERIPSSSFMRIGAVGDFKGTIEDLKLKIASEDVEVSYIRDGDKYNPDFLWEVWEAPREGFGYVIGVDIASGEGSQNDHSVAHVKRLSANGTIYHCATLRSNMVKPYEFGRLCLWGAMFYNHCWIVSESEGLASAFHSAVEFYPFLWKSEVYKGLRTRPGLIMTKDRPKILENERDLLENSDIPFINEEETLEEMSLMAYVTKGTKIVPDHVSGGRSDGVMASAMADFVLVEHKNVISDNKPKEQDKRGFPFPRYGVIEGKVPLGNKNIVRSKNYATGKPA